MPRNPSLSEVTNKIAQITSGPPRELVEAVVKALEEHRDSPIEVQARAAIAAMGEIDSWQPAAARTEAETAYRRTMIDAALPDFERVVDETGILKPKP